MKKPSLIQQWKDLSPIWKIANILLFLSSPWAIIPVILGIWTLGPKAKKIIEPIKKYPESNRCETNPYYTDTIEKCK